MPNSPRMIWPYPGENQDPWYDVFQSMVTAMDASGYASREDRQLLWSGGGLVSFESSTGLLSWAEAFVVVNPITARKTTIAAGSLTLPDASFAYINLTRGLIDNETTSFQVALSAPNTDDACVFAVRLGSNVYFRIGRVLPTGSSINIFEGGGGGGGGSTTDTYERASTFGVPEGASSQEATLGRVLYAGALTGLTAEITRAVTAGTVTVNVKIGGTTALSVVLNTSSPLFARTTCAPTLYPVSVGTSISVEVVGAGYANGDGEDAGVSVTAGFSTNVDLVPTEIPFASSTQAGITKLSVDPASPTDPIALAANDPDVAYTNRWQSYSKAQGVLAATLVYAPIVSTNASLSNVFDLALSGSATMGNPTNLINGFTYIFRITQAGTGGNTLSFDTNWKFPAGTPPTITPTLGAVDVISAVAYFDLLYCSFIQDVR